MAAVSGVAQILMVQIPKEQRYTIQTLQRSSCTLSNEGILLIDLKGISEEELRTRKVSFYAYGVLKATVSFQREYDVMPYNLDRILSSELSPLSLLSEARSAAVAKYKRIFASYSRNHDLAGGFVGEALGDSLPPVPSINLTSVQHIAGRSLPVIVLRCSSSIEEAKGGEEKPLDAPPPIEVETAILPLAAESPVVLRMFESGYSESRESRIVIQYSGSHSGAVKIVDFLFQRKLNPESPQEAFEIGKFADQYMMRTVAVQVKPLSDQYIWESCDPVNLSDPEGFSKELQAANQETLFSLFDKAAQKVDYFYRNFLAKLPPFSDLQRGDAAAGSSGGD